MKSTRLFLSKRKERGARFTGVEEVILSEGLFCSLYVDRGAHYFHTPVAGGKIDHTNPTEFGRAMNQLGIELIGAYSPEARGRSERMFGTLQGRLPKELKLAGITEMESANKFLKETFIPVFNQRFRIKPEEEISAFVPWLNTNMNLGDILCIHAQRTVNKDNTVRYNNKVLQIPQDKFRWSYHKTKVRVNEYQDGSMALFHGPRCLGHYDAEGQIKKGEPVICELKQLPAASG